MKCFLSLITLTLITSCAAPKYLHRSIHDGVSVAYRWDHSRDKPSELLMRMENVSTEDRRISLVIDIYHQGRTVETLQADTCIKVGQAMSGKLNGIYFVPESVTREQIESGDVQLELTRTFVEPLTCP